MRMVILSYTLQQVIINVCTKLKNPRSSSFDPNFRMHYIGVRDGKKEKEGKINFNIVFFIYTIYFHPL